MTGDDLRELVAALKHDLAKYVAWTSANLPDSVWVEPVPDDLLAALRRDVLATRTRDGRDEAAWAVWERLTADLPRPLSEPELVAVEAAVGDLRAAEPALRAGDARAVGARQAEIRAAQRAIRGSLRDLHSRLAKQAQ